MFDYKIYNKFILLRQIFLEINEIFDILIIMKNKDIEGYISPLINSNDKIIQNIYNEDK